MDRLFQKIVSDRNNLNDSVDWEALHKYARRIPISDVCRPWTTHLRLVTHLHILGAAGEAEPCCYTDPTGAWMLLVFPSEDLRYQVLSCCSEQLTLLDIRFTHMNSFYVRSLMHLRKLNLSYNSELTVLNGLETLGQLEILNVHHSPIGPKLVVKNTALTEIRIEGTNIEQVQTSWPLTRLKRFAATGSLLCDTAFLRDLPMLEYLDLEACPIEQLQNLNEMINLRHLDLSWTSITNLNHMVFPAELQMLSLAGLEIERIPNGIRELKKLHKLDLSYLILQELPQWLPELGLDFHTASWSGIVLTNTAIKGVDMSIFNEPQNVIRQWFRERVQSNADTPANEIKVVFLGDGEAGKSLTLARLWDPEIDPKSFKGDVTPGIDIKSKLYQIRGHQIRVNFWDFGGQEILHSMHRMFLSERTLYIVVLNTRNDNQNDRARFWLRYVNTYAQEAPVLLVMNKMDQNPHATINEMALRREYPNLKKVIGISAREYSEQQFEETFATELTRQIQAFEIQEAPFLQSWIRVRDKLHTDPRPRMARSRFLKLCTECGVGSGAEERNALLRKLHETGACVWFEGGASIKQQMLLDPQWITNAIYMILFNKPETCKNGIISHDAIYALFDPDAEDIKKVSNESYEQGDVQYVLDVMRAFRLSFAMEEQDAEFIPVFCDRNERPVLQEYAEKADTLEFRMRYHYLPPDVLYQLMVERKNELDLDNVWLTGARFRQEDGCSAVVCADGDMLIFYVRCDASRNPAKVYLDQLKGHVKLIANSRKRQVRVEQMQMVYKFAGKTECFDYERLLLSQACKIKLAVSKALGKPVAIQDILDQTDCSVDRNRDSLLRDVLSACVDLQSDITFRDADENSRNRFLRAMLRKKYIVHDQSEIGESSTGIQSGELDLDIRQEEDMPWIILEALNISGAGKTDIKNWNKHLDKMMVNYNPSGLRVLVLVSYLECAQKRFDIVSDTYFGHMKEYAPGKFGVRPEQCAYMLLEGLPQNVHITQADYNCNGYRVTVYHYLVLFRTTEKSELDGDD